MRTLTRHCVLWWRTSVLGVFLLIGLPRSSSYARNPFPTQATPQQSSGPLRDAQSDLEHGHPEEAVRILLNYLQSYPDDSRARTRARPSVCYRGADRASAKTNSKPF